MCFNFSYCVLAAYFALHILWVFVEILIVFIYSSEFLKCFYDHYLELFHLSSVQPFSHVQLCDPMNPACQASLSITNSRSLHKLRSIELVKPSNHLIMSCPSPPAFSLSQHQGLFQWVNPSHEVAKVLEFQLQHQSFQWKFRTDLL